MNVRLRRDFLAICWGLSVAGCALETDNGSSDAEPVAAASALVQQEALDDEYVTTPSARVHKTCVYEVESGSVIELDGTVRRPNGVKQTYPRCKYPMKPKRRAVGSLMPETDGWVESIEAIAPANPFGSRQEYASVYSSWTVPPAPTNNGGQLIYIFPALYNQDGILQPVLQYGVGSANGGGYRWEIASWYVTSSNTALFSRRIRVNANDRIDGHVYVHHNFTWPDGTRINAWWVRAWLGNTDTTLAVQLRADRPFTRAVGAALEVLNLTQCNQYPNTSDILFTNMRTWMPTPTGSSGNVAANWFAWESNSLNPDNCGFGQSVVSATSGRLFF